MRWASYWVVGLYPRMHLKRTATENEEIQEVAPTGEKEGSERLRNCFLSLFFFFGRGRWCHTTGYVRSFPTRDQTYATCRVWHKCRVLTTGSPGKSKKLYFWWWMCVCEREIVFPMANVCLVKIYTVIFLASWVWCPLLPSQGIRHVQSTATSN